MDFNFDVTLIGWAALIIAALAVGVVGQLVGRAEFGYEWIFTAVGAFLGAFVASEFVIGWRAIDPIWESIALIPAIGGLLIVGAVVAVAARLFSGGHYMQVSPT